MPSTTGNTFLDRTIYFLKATWYTFHELVEIFLSEIGLQANVDMFTAGLLVILGVTALVLFFKIFYRLIYLVGIAIYVFALVILYERVLLT